MKQNKTSGFKKGNSEAGFKQLWWNGHFSSVVVFLHLERGTLEPEWNDPSVSSAKT